MCEKPGIAIIRLLNSTGLRSSRDLAYSVVQVIGLNMGLAKDLNDHCVCSGDLCMMEDQRQADGISRDWSTCSKLKLAELRTHPPRACDPSTAETNELVEQISLVADPIAEHIKKADFIHQLLPWILTGILLMLLLLLLIIVCNCHRREEEDENEN